MCKWLQHRVQICRCGCVFQSFLAADIASSFAVSLGVKQVRVHGMTKQVLAFHIGDQLMLPHSLVASCV